MGVALNDTSAPSFGLDRLSSDPSLAPLVAELRSARVALLAHPASVTRKLVHALEVLRGLGIVPRILFGPEHGWAGHAQDMIGVGDATDAGARVVSLYGERFEDLSPRREHLEGIDVVVIDLQDVGSRYYTFVWTAVLVARACRAAGGRVVVLDRPNPLGGVVIEGRLQDERFKSFVGLERLPIRHGLTLGEIVAWRAKVEGYEDIVTVVRASGLDRGAHAPAWGRPFVMPSPNMPTYDTALVYPGGCLLEGTNLSDGRGTTRPFELTGAPWVDGETLARGLGSSPGRRRSSRRSTNTAASCAEAFRSTSPIRARFARSPLTSPWWRSRTTRIRSSSGSARRSTSSSTTSPPSISSRARRPAASASSRATMHARSPRMRARSETRSAPSWKKRGALACVRTERSVLVLRASQSDSR